MSTLILPRKDIKGLLNMSSVIEVVEEAFAAYAIGKAKMPPKSYLVVGSGDFRAMPASLPGAVGLKWVSVHPQNQSLGLPTVMAILIYNDPATGYPLAIMDATEITAYRTSAGAAVASKYLARRDSHTIGIIGAGFQAHTQILAHAGLFNPISVNVFDVSKAAVDRLMRSFPQFSI